MNKTQDEALFELNTKWGETIQGVGAAGRVFLIYF